MPMPTSLVKKDILFKKIKINYCLFLFSHSLNKDIM